MEVFIFLDKKDCGLFVFFCPPNRIILSRKDGIRGIFL